MLGIKSATSPELVEGTVKKWISGKSKKGSYSFGFIDVGDGKDVFAHGPTLGLTTLDEGQKVKVAFKDVTVPKTGQPGRAATKLVLA